MPDTHGQRSQVSPRTVWTVGLNALALAGLVAIVLDSTTLISWLLVALFVALALYPPVGWLMRKGWRKGLAVLAVYLVAGAFVSLLGVTLVPMLVEQGRDLVEAAPELLQRIEEHPSVRWADKRFNLIDRVQEELRDNASQAAAPALAVAAGALRGVAGAVTVLALSVFFLLFGQEVFETGLEWLAPERRRHTAALASRMLGVVGRYVAGTFLVASVGGVVMGVTVLLLGVPYFLPLGLVMVVLGIIPFIGSALGALAVVGTTLAAVGFKAAVIAAVVYIVYQQVENELLQPLIQRHTLKMNPLIITVVMLLGTSLAGVLGALLALPLAGAVQVLLQDGLARRKARWQAAPGLEGSPGASGTSGDEQPREGPREEAPH